MILSSVSALKRTNGSSAKAGVWCQGGPGGQGWGPGPPTELAGTEHREGSQPLTPGNVKRQRPGPGPRCPRKAAPPPHQGGTYSSPLGCEGDRAGDSHSLGEADPLPRGDQMGTHGVLSCYVELRSGYEAKEASGQPWPRPTPLRGLVSLGCSLWRHKRNKPSGTGRRQ